MALIELDPIPVESSFSEKKLAYKKEGRMMDKSSGNQTNTSVKKPKEKIRRDISASQISSTRREI